MKVKQIDHIQLSIQDYSPAADHETDAIARYRAEVLFHFNGKWNQVGSEPRGQRLMPPQLFE
jgi:hypothetical protein